MRAVAKFLLMAGLLIGLVRAASAQTADEVVEKHLAASGGRAALGKIKSRSVTGTITLSTPVGDVSGTIELLNELPNKSRSAMKLDLSGLGFGQAVVDQRFDGQTGYVLDSFQGNRDITGNQLDNMKNSSFPSPFLNYKERGATVELNGKEKVGERDTYVLLLKPKSGSEVRTYLDAESYLPIKVIIKVNVPQLGRDLEQTTEVSDYRDVDGVKIPFRVKNTSEVQTYVINITKVEHNLPVDETLFSKPATDK